MTNPLLAALLSPGVVVFAALHASAKVGSTTYALIRFARFDNGKGRR
jgi:hypothetical protein